MATHAQEIKSVTLDDRPISIEEFVAVARFGARVEFSPSYEERVRKSRGLIEKFLDENRVIYGVTTGFGDNVTRSSRRRMQSRCSGTSSFPTRYQSEILSLGRSFVRFS